MDNRPIGYFDSGIGGLTALKEHLRILPNEDTIYVADEANLPYGTKTISEITQFSSRIVKFLNSQNVKAIICACNTSSALALSTLKSKFSIPIFGVIEAGSMAAARATQNKKIVTLATNATVKSKKYDDTLHSINSDLITTDFAAQDLVKIVEEGGYQNPQVKEKINTLLKPLKSESADTMILGCTHFPIIEEQIDDATGHRFEMINSGEEAVKLLAQYLSKNNLAHDPLHKNAIHTFYTTGEPSHFKDVAEQFLQTKIQTAKGLKWKN